MDSLIWDGQLLVILGLMLARGGDGARVNLFVQREGKVSDMSDAHSMCVCCTCVNV